MSANAHGGQLDPAFERVIAPLAAAPHAGQIPVQLMREQTNEAMIEAGGKATLSRGGSETEIVTDTGIQITLFRPAPEARACLVFLHGGGWVIGSRSSYAAICRRLAEASGFVIGSVEYQLAPEHPFPAAVHDALDATEWILDNAVRLGLDPDSVGVGGDSAGGNLAGVVSRTFRDRGTPLALQLLLYPAVSLTELSASFLQYAHAPILRADEMRWFWEQYFGQTEDMATTDASPLAGDDFEGLPPTILITAENDILRDDAETYGARLAAAGVDIVRLRTLGVTHAFMNFGKEYAPVRHIFAAAGAMMRSVLADTRVPK